MSEKIFLEDYKEEIRSLYFEKKLSLRKIVKLIKFSTGLIRKNMVIWNMPRRESTRNVIKPPRKALEELYIKKRLNMRQIAKKLNVSSGTISKWINKYKIPIRKIRYKKNDFSGDPNEKACILGLVAGDLYVRKNFKVITVELTTTHPKMVDLFYSVFQKYGTQKRYPKFSKNINRYEWRVYIYLNDTFDFMLSDNFDIDNEYFYYFLAGFFDCEDCLHTYDNHSYIGLTFLLYNYNKELLEAIKRRLERDGFHLKFSIFMKKGGKTGEGTNNYYRKADLWAIRLHTNKEVLSLMNIMPIKHEEKISKLKIINSINTNDKWSNISNQVNNLRMNIKKEVKEYTNPLNFHKNETSQIL